MVFIKKIDWGVIWRAAAFIFVASLEGLSFIVVCVAANTILPGWPALLRIATASFLWWILPVIWLCFWPGIATLARFKSFRLAWIISKLTLPSAMTWPFGFFFLAEKLFADEGES